MWAAFAICLLFSWSLIFASRSHLVVVTAVNIAINKNRVLLCKRLFGQWWDVSIVVYPEFNDTVRWIVEWLLEYSNLYILDTLLIEYCPKLIYDIFIEFLMIKKQIWHLERYLVTLLLASILGERISSDGKILTIIFWGHLYICAAHSHFHQSSIDILLCA